MPKLKSLFWLHSFSCAIIKTGKHSMETSIGLKKLSGTTGAFFQENNRADNVSTTKLLILTSPILSRHFPAFCALLYSTCWLSTFLQCERSVTYLRPSFFVLCQPAGVSEQQNLIILEAVNVKRPEKLTQPSWQRWQSLGWKRTHTHISL